MTTPPEDIRALASQLADATSLSFDPATVRKGTVTAHNPNAAPPNISVQLSGDTETTIDAVRYLDSYSPVVNDTVLIIKQGTDIFALGQLNDSSNSPANGWIQPTLSSGFTSNGNSNGALEYRLVIDAGERKMQWRGAVSHTGTNTAIISAGNVLAADYRPTARRTLILARDEGGGSNGVKVDFNTDGSVSMIGATTAPSGSGSTGSAGTGSTGAAGDTHAHSHGGAVLLTSFGETHVHSGPSHTHTMGSLSVDHPTWISFNGTEYFL